MSGATRLWITWERQRRNRSMAAAVGAELHELDFRGHRLLRYPVLAWRTLRLLRTSQPAVVFFQNPSIVLATLITILKLLRLIRGKTVGDFHNAGVYPPVCAFLVPWIVRSADLVIVTNNRLEAPITQWRGRVLSMPDPLPDLPARSAVRKDDGTFDILFICSWASDEPIKEVLLAAETISRTNPEIRLAITGRPRLPNIGWNGALPANVELTGFLSEHAFEQRLSSSDLIIDLTTRADCMVCGAYEAVASGTPVLLSDNPPTREYFPRGTLFTDNTAADIAKRAIEARGNSSNLLREVAELREEIRLRERTALQRLERALQDHA